MEVKGTAVVAIRNYVKGNFPQQYDSWIGALSEKVQPVFNDVIDSTKWYPVSIGAIEPTLKIGEILFNKDYKKAAWESGRYSAEKGLTGIYKIYVKASTPMHIVNRASRVFSTYYRPCTIELTRKVDRDLVLEIRDLDHDCHEVVYYRVGGWIQRALEVSGAKDVDVKIYLPEESGNKEVEIKITWK